MTTFSTFVNFKFASSFEIFSSVRLAWYSSIQCRSLCFSTRTDLFENLAEIGIISSNKQRSPRISSLFCNSSNSEWKVFRRSSEPEESILVIARIAGLLISSDLYSFNSWKKKIWLRRDPEKREKNSHLTEEFDCVHRRSVRTVCLELEAVDIHDEEEDGGSLHVFQELVTHA